MSNEHSFETYLFISQKKFIICVINNISLETIYSEQILLDDSYNDLILKRLNEFIENNIFKIEKILNNFVKNVYIILDSKEFFSVKLSIKKDNNGNHIDFNSLTHPLNDLKNSCQTNFNEKKIIHMIIENYLVDNISYSSLPLNKKCNFFSLDVNFICLSKNFIDDLEKILKKYHIMLSQILYADYVENFIDQNHQTIFSTASRIKSGLNENEVLLVGKTLKNKGFFEKFFDFFS